VLARTEEKQCSVGKARLNCISIGKLLHSNDLLVSADGVNSRFLTAEAVRNDKST
jgi:hypothetical protein